MKRLLVPVAYAALFLTGCSSSGSPKAAPTNIAPTAEESTIPQTGPAATKPGASPQAGCPVDGPTLQKAVKEDPKLGGEIPVTQGLKDIVCYQDYATAATQEDNADSATVLFKFDTAKKMWVALVAGTDFSCAEQKVPKDVMAHLPKCVR